MIYTITVMINKTSTLWARWLFTWFLDASKI